VFPELTLTGYPPEDLLFRDGFLDDVEAGLQRVRESVSGIATIVGYPQRSADGLTNAAALINNGDLQAVYHKRDLPNYSVFDEKRYFVPGNLPCVVELSGVRLGLSICEDIWHKGPVEESVAAGADLIININASPFHMEKVEERYEVVSARAKGLGRPVIYVNQVGGQDELVFDGGSFAVNADGGLACRAACFEESIETVVAVSADGIRLERSGIIEPADKVERVYQALVLGVADYVNKNGFPGVVLGLSGGIDSALTAAIAVDALGAERVVGIMMPFRYTSGMSLEDAEAEARALGIAYHVISIEPMFDSFSRELRSIFADKPADTTEENMQARCRGLLLMAFSNKHGHMVLTTGNKSEMAVGYATLYGDMVGGYSAIKDVPKTLVYALAEYRNGVSPSGPVIPQRVLDRPPSAELAPGQVDEDSLPPYDILDQILEMYIEEDISPNRIVKAGFDELDVYHVVDLVDSSEYKRRQAAPGVRITRRAFGRDRRYPITSGFRKRSRRVQN
jgi:NAD+ synthase (glutamine-hydrolysing)